MKKWTLATTLAIGVVGLSACSQADSDVVVETANGNITKEAFYEEMKNQHGEAVLQQMVMKEVLDDEFSVSEEEVNKEVDKLKEQFGDNYDMALQQMGVSNEDEFKELLEFSLMQQKAATSSIEVTDEEIQKHYDRMKTELEASHILLDSEEKAKEVAKLVEKGDKNFAELAKEHSVGPSAPNGGELGTFGPGKMDPAFEDAAYALDKGKVSKPVQSSFGWHIIKVTDKKEVDVEPLEDIKEDIKSEIQNTKLQQPENQQKAQETMDKLIKDADVKVKVEGLEDMYKEEDSQEEPSEDSQE
ncbi:peptidylprolyl isomerase [Pontibacillus litoralis]|uniref:Foldase protein PrsA n=1 Tax=Pontibacillus litoralis JSM 072002 TaxID=1385512 RepID=A0A0A5FWU5_9BACI|nr:peptidylprolyl isomerase [Pontibacillus litoralis]KGX85276.1 foldase PrsA [Pontibacillus litoralis JSM 072002]